jgi:hypothetical protein
MDIHDEYLSRIRQGMSPPRNYFEMYAITCSATSVKLSNCEDFSK